MPALSVARLHEQTGMLEMTGFEFLSADGYLQKTTLTQKSFIQAIFMYNMVCILRLEG